jgi:hypothetical protein
MPFAVPASTYRETASKFPHSMSSSYDIDSDEEAEQRIGEHPPKPIEEFVTSNGDSSGGRYDDLLAEVGLQGKIKHIGGLPQNRRASCYDIFCNRELKQDKLGAVGFDM